MKCEMMTIADLKMRVFLAEQAPVETKAVFLVQMTNEHMAMNFWSLVDILSYNPKA